MLNQTSKLLTKSSIVKVSSNFLLLFYGSKFIAHLLILFQKLPVYTINNRQEFHHVVFHVSKQNFGKESNPPISNGQEYSLMLIIDFLDQSKPTFLAGFTNNII